jgi:RNA polymerase sigma-70 factor (ECF subfamily)
LNVRLDESVVRASQQGNKSAYAVLVKRYYRHVFALSLGVLGNVHDAEDVAQETMLKGFLKINKLNRAEQFEPWILHIAKNLCIDFLRRQKRTRKAGIEPPTQAGHRASQDESLQQAIRRLPQELRLPLTMYYFDGRNAKTIAEKLNISHSGACQRIRAARKLLHKILTERADHE